MSEDGVSRGRETGVPPAAVGAVGRASGYVSYAFFFLGGFCQTLSFVLSLLIQVAVTRLGLGMWQTITILQCPPRQTLLPRRAHMMDS